MARTGSPVSRKTWPRARCQKWRSRSPRFSGPADSQNQTTVTPHQFCKRGLVPLSGKQRQQLGVGWSRPAAFGLVVVRLRVHRGASIVAEDERFGREIFWESFETVRHPPRAGVLKLRLFGFQPQRGDSMPAQGGAPVGRLPWADLGLPRWGEKTKVCNFKNSLCGWVWTIRYRLPRRAPC